MYRTCARALPKHPPRGTSLHGALGSTGLFGSAARSWGEFRGDKNKRCWPGPTHSLASVPAPQSQKRGGSVFHVPSVFRGIIDSHCPRPPGTSWSHGTPRTSRCPRSVHFLALPQISRTWERRVRALLRKLPPRQPSDSSLHTSKYPKHCPGPASAVPTASLEA